jgi:hypothetical protein
MTYKIGRPLDIEDNTYIPRQADGDLLRSIRRKDYVLILEPHLQGKTSLILRLPNRLKGEEAVPFLVLTTVPPRDQSDWYGELRNRIVEQLAQEGLVEAPSLPAVADHNQWQAFIKELARRAKKPVVIVLDEIGRATEFAGASNFFESLHGLFTDSRISNPALQNVSFVLVGAVEPRAVVRTGVISFVLGIANRIRLPDFSEAEVLSLARKRTWPRDVAEQLASRVYFWTEGHPQLTHLMCSRLMPGDTPDCVDGLVETFRQEGRIARPHLEQPELKDLFDRVVAGERIPFHPADQPAVGQLEMLGLIKGKQGFCAIRTEVNRKIFGARREFDVFLSYRRAGGSETAEILKEKLELQGLRVFMDVHNMSSGPFPETLRSRITDTPAFLALLSPHCLDRPEENDVMRREIDHALRVRPKGEVVPVMMKGFQFPANTGGIASLHAVDGNGLSNDEWIKEICRILRGILPFEWKK